MMIRVIITGATGMVGEGVLHECLHHPAIAEVLIINRKAAGIQHPKLKEIIHADFFDLSAIEDQLLGYDACFFCAGVTSIGKNEAEYTLLTYYLTMNFAKTLTNINPVMTFCYISGSNTDSTEKGRIMWARVKGKTENDLMKLPFKQVYNFRPGLLKPTPGLKNTLGIYKFVNWLYPLARKLLPKEVSTLKELGLAMIKVAISGYHKPNVEVEDIVKLAARV